MWGSCHQLQMHMLFPVADKALIVLLTALQAASNDALQPFWH